MIMIFENNGSEYKEFTKRLRELGVTFDDTPITEEVSQVEFDDEEGNEVYRAVADALL